MLVEEIAVVDAPAPPPVEAACELTILMPCLNEAETLAVCIDKAMGFLARRGVSGEVLVADNGSTDGSPEIARAHGARVVAVAEKGYGAALTGGIEAARGRYVVMGDADDSYDFANLDAFLTELRAGRQLVMGNRFRGGIAPGAMPPLHRWLGNPVLSFIGRLLFRSPCGDFHCGLRGFDRDAMRALDLHTTGMEFASEMVVKATLHGLSIAEVPTTLSPDGRSRPPHLRSWRDGWRHLRFLLMYSPRWLFLYPGLALLLVGTAGLLVLLAGPLSVGGTTFDVHTMLVSALAVLVGAQAVTFCVVAREYAVARGLLPASQGSTLGIERLSLEGWLIGGGVLAAMGLAAIATAVAVWGGQGFGPLEGSAVLRLVIPGVTAAALGVQFVFAGFFRSIVTLKAR